MPHGDHLDLALGFGGKRHLANDVGQRDSPQWLGTAAPDHPVVGAKRSPPMRRGGR
ncbi:hypothetical protein [Nocardia acidivorans]|uniref:hypothetical protein n=1 Tax=Nocardia acidivorans TaxID=404580 RepID=UPI000A861BD9|nr:hypothetical protein [Nocardia acidivorans]